MKRRLVERGRRAPSPYTKRKKAPYQYPDWIQERRPPPKGSWQARAQDAA